MPNIYTNLDVSAIIGSWLWRISAPARTYPVIVDGARSAPFMAASFF
jgi:hypothetical protein